MTEHPPSVSSVSLWCKPDKRIHPRDTENTELSGEQEMAEYPLRVLCFLILIPFIDFTLRNSGSRRV